MPGEITYVAISHAHKDHSANVNQCVASTWLARPAERAFMWKPGNERVEPSFYNKLEKSKSISIEKDEYDVYTLLSIRIGRSDASRARYHLDAQGSIDLFLQALIDAREDV